VSLRGYVLNDEQNSGFIRDAAARFVTRDTINRAADVLERLSSSNIVDG